MSATSRSLTSTNDEKVAPVKTFDGHNDWVMCVAWYPDGRRIASASWNGELQIWDTETGLQVGEKTEGHTNQVWALDVSPDGTRIASGSEDRTVKLWDSETGELKSTCDSQERVRDVHFSPDSKKVASGSGDQTMRIWDVETGELAFEPVKCEGRVRAVRYSPSGDRIASGAGRIQIWDISDSSVGLVRIIEQSVRSLAWTHDGEHIIGGGDGVVTMWNASSGEQIHAWQTSTGWIQLSLSPTTTHLAICSWNAHQILVFDMNTGERIAVYKHDDAVNYIAYSPSGKFIATAYCRKNWSLWEARRSSRSPGSSILDLPAITRPADAQKCDQVAERLPCTSISDPPLMFGQSDSVQPANQTRRRHRRTLSGAIEGVFRLRGQSQQEHNCPSEPNTHDRLTRIFREFLSRSRSSFPFKSPRRNLAADKIETIQERSTPQGNWIAEARTRPIYAFETGLLPDEVERGCFFHLASYICYARRDPNVRVPSHNVPTSATSSAPGISPPAPETIATHSRGLTTYPPTVVTAPTTSQASAASLSARIRALLGQLFTFPGSHQHPGAIANGHSPAISSFGVPAVVVTSPSPESAGQFGSTAGAHQVVSLIPPSTGHLSPLQSTSSQSLPQRVAMDMPTPNPAPRTSDSALQPSMTWVPSAFNTATTPLSPHDSTLVPAMNTQRAPQGNIIALGALSVDEVAVLQEYRWQKENLGMPTNGPGSSSSQLLSTAIPSIVVSAPSSGPGAHPDGATGAPHEPLLSSSASSTMVAPPPVCSLPVEVDTSIVSPSHLGNGTYHYDDSDWPPRDTSSHTQISGHDQQIKVFEDSSVLFDNPWAGSSPRLLSCNVPDTITKTSLSLPHDIFAIDAHSNCCA